ncbi:predicted protein, partial [Nematostella vectensis]
VKIPSREFTIEFWVRPEGGQHSPVPILGLYDLCSSESKDRGWRIGLVEKAPEKSVRLFYSLRTARSNRNTTLLSDRRVEPHHWVHVAGTYDGRYMKFYINQAKVGVSSDQKGHVFASPLISESCEVIEAGGERRMLTYFRGSIDQVKFWSVPRTHKEISEEVFGKKTNPANLIFVEDFSGIGNKILSWLTITETAPEIVESTIPSDKHDLALVRPPCGSTVCDNPEVVRSYVNNTHLRQHKTLRFRVINVMNDDGSDPIVSKAQIRHQTKTLNDAFSVWNITWEMHEVEVRNTSLRGKTVLFMCSPSEIGDMRCNKDYCNLPITGYDGGDCIEGGYNKCDPAKRGNGQCDPECNRHDHAWDYGDCCDPSITLTDKTCFDPTSLYRAYLSLKEYKELLNFDNARFLNVYFKQCGDNCDETFQGTATFPWENTVHSVLGGVLINPGYFGQKGHSNSIIHEFGHALGLWHVHRGVTELKCTDECHETFPSMELGDLCSDTNPTPLNKKCRDPALKRNDMVCGRKYFRDTPFRNYMSYADDSCTNSFTPQQAARMHCYADFIFQSWQAQKTGPSFIPIPPRVTSETPGSVSIAWIPPLGTGGANAMNMCHLCAKDDILEQYAVTAFSPIKENRPNGYWAPQQALGAPDAKRCVLDPKAWNPMQKAPRSCPNCYIELGFKEAIIPTELSIWVTWHPKNGISDIWLIFFDGTHESLGNATAQCDSPLTMAVRTHKKVVRVRIYTYTSIDAVKLTSSVSHPNCRRCKPVHYLVSRDPPFLDGQEQVTKTTGLRDSSVKQGQSYTYTVRAVTSSGLKSPPSPPLTYTPKRGFCGDGRVDEKAGEECDDGNVRDGDGCNMQCKKEDVFHCEGHPSLCYRHDGDGVCEEFERMYSIRDCGFYTPEGFLDQWARNASANPDYQLPECPASRVIGPPVRDLVCKPDPDLSVAWAPCGHYFADSDYWLQVTFEHAVVPAAVLVYLASDGRAGPAYDEFVKTIEVDLYDTEGNIHESGSKEVSLSCKTNPAVVHIRHDMTMKFYYSRKVRLTSKSYMVAIAGVTLRSLTSLDPVALAGCGPDELYNPRTQRCHKYNCDKPKCPPLLVKRATVKCEGDKEGQRCVVTCAKGYRPRRPFKMLCLHGKWRGAVDKCVPVDCGIPKIPNAKANCPKGTKFGSTCVFRCVPNAKMTGLEHSITCEDDGKWSAQQSFCIMTCAVPPIPPNALAISGTCIGEKGKYKAWVSCKFRCKTRFRLQVSKDAPSKKVLKVRCTKEGTWTLNSHCVPITCPAPPPYLRYWYNCTHGDAMGSLCTSSCPDAKSHQIKCGGNGYWSSPFMKCKTAGSCGVPPQIPGLKFTCSAYSLKATCKVTCTAKNYDAVVKVIRVGKEDIWGVSIACDSKLKWEPDPMLITCLKECRKDIGDGWCDEKNNNQHCRWDGGDCCASTTKDRMVRRSPPHCGKACDCLDPSALENRR